MLSGDPSNTLHGTPPTGFTLVEVMVAVLIAAILLAVAAPAMQNLLAANQLTALTDSFAAALSEARSEAAKLSAPVALTTAGGVNWGSGWTMFVDGADLNGVQDSGATPPEVTLRTGRALPASYTLTATGAAATSFADKFWFDATGRLLNNTGGQAVAPAQFQICQGGGPPTGAARMVTVSVSGRVRISQNNSSGQPLDDSGTPITTCP